MITLTKSEIKKLENDYVRNSNTSFLDLMERAGSQCAKVFIERYRPERKRVLILCGAGNNGGDGFVIARKLSEAGVNIEVALLSEPKTDIAKINFDRLGRLNIKVIKDPENICVEAVNCDYIFDCIFGFGFHGEPDAAIAEVIRWVNNSGKTIISVDIPSGAECDTACVATDCIKSSLTLTFTTLKPALISYPAKEYAGEIMILDIGIDKDLINLIKPKIVCGDSKNIDLSFIKKRNNPQVNKGDFGKALIIAGCKGMSGAAIMAAKSAVRSGSGIVTLATVDSNYTAAASCVQECLIMPLAENSDGTISKSNISTLIKQSAEYNALLFGCGISDNVDRGVLLNGLLGANCNNIVIDADGINAVAENINVLTTVSSEKNIILTPHPGEFARLLKTTVKDVQKNRINLAVEFAKKYNVTVALKGAATVVASSDGKIFINTTGNSGMAKGGSGDVLAGITVSLLAQGLDAFSAASTAVYIHGAAGDIAAEKFGCVAMMPSDTIDSIGKAIDRLS